MTLLGGAMFQAINPKAWLLATNVALMYTASSGIPVVIIGFMAMNLPCTLIWAAVGDRLGKHLQVAWKLKLFNAVMAVSLVMTTCWMLMEAFSQ